MAEISQGEQAELVAVAHRLADAARIETLRHFRTGTAVENKLSGQGSGFDPVTRADRAAEAAMRRVLERERPQDAILGEEFGASKGRSGLTWVLDPIDGTRGYMAGTPTWGVLIALSDQEGPRFGLIDQPYIGERFVGGFGAARLDGPMGARNLATRQGVPLSEATIFTTFPEVGTAQEREGFHAVAARSRLTRYGMDCYAYALVAAGEADLVVEAGLQAYDIAAPCALVQAAGGVVTDWVGGPAHGGGRVIAAGSAAVHAEALAILRETLSGAGGN